jgi:hypothetical protein
MFIVTSFLRGIRARPFSIMALCNIVGDLCYLGFAFASEGFVSLPKLTGASFTMLAHIIMLAYGDDQARRIAEEKGSLARIFLKLRGLAQGVVACFPAAFKNRIKSKPVGIPFLMLAINGAGLLTDAILEWHRQSHFAMLSQSALGGFIMAGCCAFAAADFIPGQKTADRLTKIAPTLLSIATFTNLGIVIATRNVFMMIAFAVFTFSNFTGFFVRLDKEKGQHLHS